MSLPLPNFLIVGVPRSGTTTMHYILTQHRQVCLPRDKEAHFFNTADNAANGMDYYSRKHFSHWQGEPFIGDITPAYFNDRLTLERIATMLGRNIKIIVIFRFPVARSFSNYLHKVYLFEERQPFMTKDNNIDPFYIEHSLYADRFACLINIFGRENILPLIFERDIEAAGSETAYRKIAAFLGLPEQEGMELNQRRGSSFLPRIRQAEKMGKIKDYRGRRKYREGDIVIKSKVPDMNIPKYEVITGKDLKDRASLLTQLSEVTTSLPRESAKDIHSRYFLEDATRLKELLQDPLPEWNPDTASIPVPENLDGGKTRPSH